MGKANTGRKTDYRPEYCDKIIECGREGRSILAFAVSIGVSRTTIRNWTERYPEFAEAFAIAKDAWGAYYEAHARDLCSGEGRGCPDLVKFMLCNAAGDIYRLKQETVVSTTPETQFCEALHAADAAEVGNE